MEDRNYIGKVEAFEVMLERGIDKLPKKGQSIITCYAVATLKGYDDVLGKDEHGYFLAVMPWASIK